jgi:predicted  nucleic acid-binding Zn-ribbon protein
MPKPPKELTKQIGTIQEIIESLNDVIGSNKIKIEHYGKDFIEPLNEIRKQALELRSNLEVFKNNLEYALTAQYSTSERFASSSKAVIDKFLSRSY